MTFTPGPWVVREKDWKDSKMILPGGGFALALVYRRRRIDGTCIHDAEANARLIAAAPDLLAACKVLLLAVDAAWEIGDLSPVQQVDEACEQASAAIASATGNERE